MRAHLLAAVALAACETSQPPPCPGTPVGTFGFQAIDGGTACTFAGLDGGAPAVDPFDATVSWDPNGTAAAICIQRPYADPFLGTHDRDHFTVSHTSTGNTVSLCDTSCSVTIVEEVDGGIEPDDGGPPSGFSGTLKDSLTGFLADGGPSSCNCGLPCTVTYTLQGGPP